MGIHRTIIALVIAAEVAAQGLSWQLPHLGAAEYRRQWSAQSSVAESRTAALSLGPRGAVPDSYLPRLCPAPWLCQSELRNDQSGPATPPRDLRDLIRMIALDLGGRGPWRCARLPPFGDLTLGGRIGAVDKAGDQQLELTVSRRPPTGSSGEGKEVKAALAELCPRDVDGTLRIARRIDATRGLVVEFTGELSLVVEEETKRFRRLELRDAWQLVAVRDGQDADFRARVAAAVRAGSTWIRSALEGGDATYLQDRDGEHSFGSGRIALAALTLLHAEVPPSDPVLQAALTTLRRRKLTDTYALATALMTMAQLHAPPREAENIRTGIQATRTPRQLDATDKKLAQRWLDRLLENRDTRVDPASVLRFDYDGGKRYDNSLSQYGLLGLDAAALCGLEIAPSTWLAAGNHFVAVQCPSRGRSVELDLVTHRELALAAGGPVPTHPVRTAARGFAYQRADEPPYGSMTAACLAGLVVARVGAERAGSKPAELRTLDAAIAGGFAWLADEFTVRSNPGWVGHCDHHWYYWLYSLERACELAGIAQLCGRDWYHEGAVQLLAQQQQNGSFRADRGDTLLLEATCFAVLFLKKSTLPAITGR